MNSSLGLTLEQYAEAKRFPVEFLKSLGMSTISYMEQPAVRIPYLDQRGMPGAARFRLALEGPDRFRWKTGARPSLYGLWQLDAIRSAGEVTIVEGESDAQTLWLHSIPALGIPGASSWQEQWAGFLDDIPIIYVIIEPDKGGEAMLSWLRDSRIRDRVQLVRLVGAKDPSALYMADPAQFVEVWRAAVDAAVSLARIQADELTRKAAESFTSAESLLSDPYLIDRIADTIRARGYAGDGRPAMIAYVAATSRLIERPINLAFVAQSSAGKNRAVDAALDLMPPEAFYLVRASSPRALVYTDEDFQNRVVVVAEADSIPENGPAASAVRSIAEDSELVYEVVERIDGKLVTRRIKKRGPTGLITTSTRSLGGQMGTRVLEIPISDDPLQTRAVLNAHAAAAMPTRGTVVEVAQFRDLQVWLATAGERRVAVPFANVLAKLVPVQAVRMRRDFPKLLSCIKAIALLHQCQRSRTPEGWIEATIDDYAIARDLLETIFDAVAADGVTATVRAAVLAVKVGEEVSVAELGRRLGLARNTTFYRVNRAIKGGWLLNLETRTGYPARLVLGAPLPDETPALPEATTLQALFNGSARSDVNPDPLPPPEFEEGVV